MWFTDSTAGKADMPQRMISTIVKGDKAMAAGTTSVGLGLLVHLVLSALFGMLFALAVPRLSSNGTVALAGTGYGAALYLVNFLVLAPLGMGGCVSPRSTSTTTPSWPRPTGSPPSRPRRCSIPVRWPAPASAQVDGRVGAGLGPDRPGRATRGGRQTHRPGFWLPWAPVGRRMPR